MSQPEQPQTDPLGTADPLDVQDGEITLSGNPEQPAEPKDQAFGEAMAGLCVMVSNMTAQRVHPEMAISEPEARELAGAIQDCADAYLPDSQMPPWANLLLVSGAIALPRYMLLQSLKEQDEKQKKPPKKEGKITDEKKD